MNTKTGEVRQKYSAARRIFNSLLGVQLGNGQTRSLVYDTWTCRLIFGVQEHH